ncbi:hypothetical protein Golob_007771, partial [Gossypium lobatum]|nr:hypothetical protein [Gossypium lobatum]
MRTTVANLWHPCGGITISYLGKKRYLFRFYYEFDIERVMDGDPWTFNKHLLVYHQLQLGEDPLRVPLHFVDYWIQVHDLSPGLMSEGIIKQFGAFLGTYIDYDAKPISIGVGGYLCNIIFARGDKEGFAEACQNAIGKYQLAVMKLYDVWLCKVSCLCSKWVDVGYCLHYIGEVLSLDNCTGSLAWKKEIPFEWDMLLKALSKRAMVASTFWRKDKKDVTWRDKRDNYKAHEGPIGQVEIEGFFEDMGDGSFRKSRVVTTTITVEHFSHEDWGREKTTEDRLKDECCMEAFRIVHQDCDLLNLGFKGKWYTWERGRSVHIIFGKGWIAVWLISSTWVMDASCEAEVQRIWMEAMLDL